MKDQLEEFIKQHRQALDDKRPSKEVWKHIESDMKFPSTSINRSAVFFKAAAVLFLVMSSWLLYDRIQNGSQSVVEPGVSVNGQAFDEIEKFYTMIIDEKLSEVDALKTGHTDVLLEFKSELHTLDSMYIILKRDLRYGNREQILDAMILNLQLRLEILNQQSEILKNLKNIKENEEFI